jgi:hypothetical protein
MRDLGDQLVRRRAVQSHADLANAIPVEHPAAVYLDRMERLARADASSPLAAEPKR